MIQQENQAQPSVNVQIENQLTIEKMYNANWHFGDLVVNTHPSMKDYIYKNIKSYAVIDLPQANALFKEALNFIKKTVSSGGKILITGKDPKVANLIQAAAQKMDQFYITGKWFGGLLTNWHNTFSKSMRSIKEKEVLLQNPKAASNLTKRELMSLSKRLNQEKSIFSGVLEMGDQLPSIVVIIGSDQKVIKECAKMRNIATVALVDTSADATGVSYVVPGNAPATPTVQMFLSLIEHACIEGLKDQLKVRAHKESASHREIRVTSKEESSAS